MNRSTIGWLLVGLQAFLLVALVVAPGRRGWTALWPPDVAGIVGGLLVVIGAVLGVLAARRLSTALTPTPVPLAGEPLRTTGIYAWVRHPIYAAVLLVAIGYTVALGGIWQMAIVAVLVVFFVMKSRWEDSMLRALHGQEWETYRQRTWALVPRPPLR